MNLTFHTRKSSNEKNQLKKCTRFRSRSWSRTTTLGSRSWNRTSRFETSRIGTFDWSRLNWIWILWYWSYRSRALFLITTVCLGIVRLLNNGFLRLHQIGIYKLTNWIHCVDRKSEREKEKEKVRKKRVQASRPSPGGTRIFLPFRIPPSGAFWFNCHVYFVFLPFNPVTTILKSWNTSINEQKNVWREWGKELVKVKKRTDQRSWCWQEDAISASRREFQSSCDFRSFRRVPLYHWVQLSSEIELEQNDRKTSIHRGEQHTINLPYHPIVSESTQRNRYTESSNQQSLINRKMKEYTQIV